MATFEIERDGRIFEVEAPDMAAAAAAVAAMGRNTPKGPSEAVQREVARRKKFDGGAGLSGAVVDNITFGAATPLMAATSAAGSTAFKALTGGTPDFVGDYKFERDVLDERLKQQREEAGIPGTVAEIALSLPFAASSRLAQVGRQMLGSAVVQAPARSFVQRNILDPAKLGAVYSGVYGFNTARGGVQEHIDNTAGHAASGALFGPALNAGLRGAMAAPGATNAAWRFVTGRTPGNVQAANDRLAQFAQADVRPFGPAVGGGAGDVAGRNLARTMVGGSLRESAQGTIDDITAQTQRALNERTGGVPVSDLGDEIQGTLRRNLVDRTRTQAEIEAMSDAEILGIRGAAPRPIAPPTPPRPVPDVAPAPVDPNSLQYQRYSPDPVEAVPIDVLRQRLPTVDQMPVPPQVANAERQAWAAHQQTRSRLDQVRDGQYRPSGPPQRAYSAEETVEVYRQLFPQGRHPDQALLAQIDAARQARDQAVVQRNSFRASTPRSLGGPGSTSEQLQRQTELQRAVAEADGAYQAVLRRAEASANTIMRGNVDEVAGIIQASREADNAFTMASTAARQARQAEWDRTIRQQYDEIGARAQREYDARVQAAQERAARQTEEARQAAMREAQQRAEQEALEATRRARDQAQQEAAAATAQRQADLDLRWQRDATGLDVFTPGRSRESYPTEFSAAYEAANRQTPQFQRNIFGGRGMSGSPTPTATEGLLNDFALTFRAAGRLPGFRGGSVFEGGQMPRGDFMAQLSDLLGADVAERLSRQMTLRVNTSAAPGHQGLRDLATAIRRARQEAERPPFPGQPRTDRAAALRRLEGALREDYHRFLRETGPNGQALSDAVRRIDGQYREYIENLRRPLAQLFGDNVTPIQAMDRLLRGAQNGDLDMLRAYVRVMTEKADPSRGAAAIIAHATDNAQTMNQFLAGYGRIPPQVRNVLFASSEGRALRTQLDRLETLGRQMQPYQRAIERVQQGATVRPGHIMMGASFMFHFYPMLTLYGGAYGASRFMSNPRYLAWLTRTARSRTQRELDLNLARFAFIAERDADGAPYAKAMSEAGKLSLAISK